MPTAWPAQPWFTAFQRRASPGGEGQGVRGGGPRRRQTRRSAGGARGPGAKSAVGAEARRRTVRSGHPAGRGACAARGASEGPAVGGACLLWHRRAPYLEDKPTVWLNKKFFKDFAILLNMYNLRRRREKAQMHEDVTAHQTSNNPQICLIHCSNDIAESVCQQRRG